MTIETLLAPLGAATILNVFLFALMWRGSQIEKRVGEVPLALILGGIAYLGALGAFVYFSRHRLLGPGIDLFMAGLVAQALGVLVVFAILHAFIFSRGQPRANRAFAVVAALFLGGAMIAGIFVP